MLFLFYKIFTLYNGVWRSLVSASVLGTEGHMFKSYLPELLKLIFFMLSLETILKVADNSGIHLVKCLKFLNGFARNSKGTVGNLVVVSLFHFRGYIKKSTRKVFLGVIVTIKIWVRRKTGVYIRSNQNRVVLLENKEKMLGKAIKGPVSINARQQKLSKVLFLAKNIY